MVEFKDYYKTLGVPRTASAKEIKAAYRRLARKHHPDVNPGNAQAEARFKDANEAYAVLSDPEKRKRYDTLGANWDSFRHTQPPPGGGFPGGQFRVEFGEDLGGFSDFFRTFFAGFGGGFGDEGLRGRAGARRGGIEDSFERAGGGPEPLVTEAPVELTLEEVLHGTTRTLDLSQGGSHRTIEVKIPPGVRDGARVRVPARAVGAGQGDVFLRVRLQPHALFERRDDDLQVKVKVPLTTAVLGGEVQVPTLEGSLGIKVPPATPNGRTFRLRGQGLPRRQGEGRGDLLALLNVELPRELAPRERELFEELRALGH